MVKVVVHLVCALCVILGVTFAAETDLLCVTPNGENGTCIPVNSCRPIKQAIMYLNEAALEFARKSQCGYNDGPLVCCGSVGQVKSFAKTTTVPPPPTAPPPPAAPINNILLPDRSLCGFHVTENRKLAANLAEITEFPWIVALKYTKDDGTPGDFRCSGTLINERYVLTAAQCLTIPGFNLTEARLGEWKFSTKDCVGDLDYDDICEDSVVDLKIVEKIAHPYYNKRSGNNNVALLRLEKEIKYNEHIRPICLPPNDYPPPPTGTVMENSGWNMINSGTKSDIKLKSTLTMVSSENCDKVFPNYVRFYPNKVCARGNRHNNLCNGDSGSPIMRTYNNEYEVDEEQWYQEGIVHQATGCEDKEYIGLYTRVSRYLHWILNNIN